MHQLVQEAHRVRQELKDIKNAMVHALQTGDTNHTSHDQIFKHKLSIGPDQCHASTVGCNVRLNKSVLAQERESETRKARLEVLEKFIGEKLNDAMLRAPAETRNLNERLIELEEWISVTT